jgi:hypothetical protein
MGCITGCYSERHNRRSPGAKVEVILESPVAGIPICYRRDRCPDIGSISKSTLGGMHKEQVKGYELQQSIRAAQFHGEAAHSNLARTGSICCHREGLHAVGYSPEARIFDRSACDGDLLIRVRWICGNDCPAFANSCLGKKEERARASIVLSRKRYHCVDVACLSRKEFDS